MKITAHAMTDIGMKRRINQDACLKDDSLGLYVVADGMGGHRGGEVASQLAVTVLKEFVAQHRDDMTPAEALEKGINRAGEEIYKMSQENEELAGMGTTVMALLFRGDKLYVGQVGDSRAYLMIGESIWQITEDHSLLNEEIRAGRITAVQAANYQFKNVITRSVGYESRVLVDVYRRQVRPGDVYLICSDGLSGLVETDEILGIVKKAGPAAGVQKLIAVANEKGGDDNISVVVCEVLPD
ncbi:MAG: Stp1/IreP family PP2C-type Ser/Thr phosphatase [Deltaproteobacteria bacterium]|nr:Stp1/IreP family PP2C-type Ser/Thr phosphatase [Deltaproteobacteria bacterium]MBI3293699.1 Stp1/IreP family PP2C-type Ser/Thr phosphatase [Deltaproteobacteria bacterium]